MTTQGVPIPSPEHPKQPPAASELASSPEPSTTNPEAGVVYERVENIDDQLETVTQPDGAIAPTPNPEAATPTVSTTKTAADDASSHSPASAVRETTVGSAGDAHGFNVVELFVGKPKTPEIGPEAQAA